MSDSDDSSEAPLQLRFGEDDDSSSDETETMQTDSRGGGQVQPFEIPTSDDYLTMPDAQAFHVVENGEKTEEEIESEINQFTFKLADIGWRSLKDHFDAFFSLAKINSKIKRVDLSLQAVRRLLECFDLLLNGSVRTVIKRIIQIQGQPSDDVKNEATTIANYLLMLIYLLSRLSFHLEAEHMKRLLAMEKKKGARRIELDKDMETWVTLRSRMLESFTELCDLQLPDYSRQMRPGVIKYLWRPPEANKGMVMAFIETIFKFLDNPSNKAAASLRWLETLFSLVRVICIRFDYFSRMAVALVEKTVNLEYLREATANKYPFIQAIINVSQNADMDVLLEHMVHHLGDMLNHDFSTTSTKPYSLLMTTMAEYAPDIMIKQLSAILPYLKNDTPQLRSCVLQCFSHLLCSPKLSEANCLQFSRLFKVRNRMLEFCRDHLQDENATVRCKAIQVWTNLAEAGRIPPEELQKSLVYTVGDRLLDKSLVCRKAALQFLFKFLEGNPYGHDFNYNLHVKKVHELNMARRRLKDNDPSEEPTNTAIHEFEEVREEFEGYLRESLQSQRNGTADVNLGAEHESAVMLMAIGTQIVQMPLEAAKTIAALVMKGEFAHIDPTAEVERLVESCSNLCREMYCSHKRQQRDMDNEAQLHLEDRINDHTEEMARLGKEITQIIDKIMVAKEFSECIPKAMRAVLLGDLSEMKEAMQFVVNCKHFNVTGADQAVRQMCSLIWRHNQDVRHEVLKTAESLFVSNNKEARIKVKSTVTNLLSVLSGMKDEERACVEEVISKMTLSVLPEGTAKRVWKLAEEAEPKAKKIALQLIGILVKSDKDLRKYLRRMQAIVKDKQMPPRVRAEALLAIANMADLNKSSSERSAAFRIPATDSLFTCIENFVLEEFLRAPNDGTIWFDVMNSALSIYFDIAKDTSTVVSRLAAKLFTFAHRISGVAHFYTEQEELDQDEPAQETVEDLRRKYTRMYCFFTERCLVFAGELALRTVIHVDVTWFREVKRLPELVGSLKRKEITATAGPNRPLKEWEFRAAMHRGVFNYSTRDETNPHGNSDEERVRSQADNILDRRLLRPGKLLARLAPFVIFNLRAIGSPSFIRDAASVAFSKLMLVSREFSERGAPMFFMMMNNSMNPVIRHNVVIASGDLCFRMPNLVEKFSQNVYTMTKDSDPMVRETAILVLTHLLTNQMLKHKGCLADVAKLITDRATEISTLTKEFFVELGARGAIIYNLMPDFISRLSRSSRDVSLQQFKIIMTFLLQQIGKEKQMDSLVDKLTARFSYIKTEHATAKNTKIAHYYSFCIAQMNLTERAFVKMRDNLNHFASFMEDQQVYEDFKTSLEKLLKNAKSLDLQMEVIEFLHQLTAIQAKGLQGDELVRPARVARGAGSRGRPRGPTRQSARRKRTIDSDSEEEPSDIEGD